MLRPLCVAIFLLNLLYFKQVTCDDKDESSGDDEEKEKESIPCFPEILKLSIEEIISSSDANKDKQILFKYYFTANKTLSIWPKIINETEKITADEFDERELSDMEGAIRKIYIRLLECDEQNPVKSKDKKKERKKQMKNKVDCYKTLNEFIEVGFIDFNFPRGNGQQQAHKFQMNMAYNVMVLLIQHMISSMSVSSGMNSFQAQLKFYTIAEDLVDSIDPAKAAAIDSRMQLITPVVICQVQEILWQLFTGECEMESEPSTKRTELAQETVGYTMSANSTRKSAIKDLGHNVKGFGGTPMLLSQKFKATVTDDVTGEVICDEEGSAAAGESVAKAKSMLTKKCIKKRKAYVEKVQKEVQKFYSERSDFISKELPRLWDSDKAKLKKVKSELKTNDRKKENKKKSDNKGLIKD